MTQNNLYMENDEMRLYIDVQPLFIDELENSKNAAAASAAAAALSETAAAGWKNDIEDYKTDIELFYAQASDDLSDLYNDSVSGLTSVKNSALESLQEQNNTVLGNINSAKQSAINNISTNAQSYVNQARNYAEQAQNTVDNRVSLEHLNQSKALETGDISDDSDVLCWVNYLAHSLFDSSKFTVTGTTGLTSDGIIPTGIAQNNKVEANYLLPIWNNNPWEIITPLYKIEPVAEWWNTRYLFRYLESNEGVHLYYKGVNGNSTLLVGTSLKGDSIIDITANITRPTTDSIQFKIENTGTQYKLYSRLNGIGEWTFLNGAEKTNTFTLTLTEKMNFNYFGSGTEYAPVASCDLKYLKLIDNGSDGFSGCSTGTDSCTIGGNNVSIPYVLSKTGSKIVDSAYRTQFANLYNQQGYVPYYTLSDTDFTLPMGEIYGMIEKLRELIMERTAGEG